MKRLRPAQLISVALLLLILSCGLTALAYESEPDVPSTEAPPPSVPDVISQITPEIILETREELFPADVQTIIEDGTRQIIRTYILIPGQSPADIPRDCFERDGWLFTLTDITQQRTSLTESRSHIKIVEINTDSNDLNEIIPLLSPTIEYESEDGFHGVLTLDISTINCEPEGHRRNSFTVTATREYPHLSSNDVSLIPRTITENGRTLTLESVSWEVQHSVNIDHHDIPVSYRAIARYTGTGTRTVVTGYITTAEYFGEITKTIAGDTIYTAHFWGTEITVDNGQVTVDSYKDESDDNGQAAKVDGYEGDDETNAELSAISSQQSSDLPIAPILITLAVLGAVAGAAAYFHKRRNVKIYRDNFSVLIAKDKISVKSKSIDLTPLDGNQFGIEIEKLTAKSLNGKAVEIRHGTSGMTHRIAYEGNAYRIEVDFNAGTIQGIY